MSGLLEIVAAGGLATVQDGGRIGWRRLGVPRSGALDAGLLQLANALAGNPPAHPAIEFFAAGPTLRAVDDAVRVALAGDFGAELQRAGGEQRRLGGWCSVTLRPGDTLRAGVPRGTRVGCIAVAGLEAPPLLGSASSYLRAGIGPPVLRAGTRLAAGAAAGAERLLRRPPRAEDGPIRAVPGPQQDHFAAEALANFFGAEYRVSDDADRMGVRLLGPALAHAGAAEIVSDATVPGSVQVPGNGQPIVLLADGQTAGGYPKIATIASCDLARLATAAPGTVLRFERVTVAEAEALARERHAALQRLVASIEPLAADGDIDLRAIYESNLVSGIIDALA